jgi:hypothetical protein
MPPKKLAKMGWGIVEEYPHRNRGTEVVAAWPERAAGHAHVRNSRGIPSPESNRRKAQSKTDLVVLPEALNVHRDLEHPVENVEAIFFALPPCWARTAGRRDWSILPTVWYRVRNAHGTATMRHVNLGSRAISEKPERTRRSDSQHRRHAGGISGNGRRAPFPRQVRHPFDAEAPSGVWPACEDSIPRELSERCRPSPNGFR